MMTSCLAHPIWPGNRDKVKQIQEKITYGKRGNCFANGLEHKFSFKWLLGTHEGVVNLAIYLWLVKDMGWSQLTWFYLAMIFGSLASLLSLSLIGAGFYFKIYSEALIGIGMFIWLLANYIWMVGEVWGYKITLDSPDFFIPEIFKEDYYSGDDIFYDDMTELAQKVSIVGCSFLFFISFILPFCYYDENRIILLHDSSRYHFSFFFRDFLEFENFHIFLWALKDLCWLFDNYTGYIIFLIPTVILMIDTMYILYTTEDKLLEFFHYILLSLWILANLLWATSELVVETDDIPDEAWDNYYIFNSDVFEYFYLRMFSGLVYILAIVLIVCFYIYWIWFAKFDENIDDEEDNNKLETQGAPISHYELTQA